MKRLLLILLVFCANLACGQEKKYVEGLVYEAEDWSEPKDAMKLNQPGKGNWQIWTKEESVEKKRSRGASVTTPKLPDVDRETPEDGAPVLHTRITGIPKGTYQVFMNPTNRPLALSFDGGKTWSKTENRGEEKFGIYTINDGVFELWLDDRYASDSTPGWAYYDYLRFVPVEGKLPEIQDLQAFTFPFAERSTQISWTTPGPVSMTALVTVMPKDGRLPAATFSEVDTGMRNHTVTLENLEPGREYVAEVLVPLNRSGEKISQTISFVAGRKRAEQPTQKTWLRLTVAEPTEHARKDWPVTSGVPFARGVLASEANVRLENAKGEKVPARFTPTAYWQDGSIQWMTVDFLADTNAPSAAPAVYTLVLDPEYHARKSVGGGDLRSPLTSEITLADGSKRYAKVGDVQTTMVRRNGEDAFFLTYRKEGDYTESPDAQADSSVPGFRWRMEGDSWLSSGLNRVRWTIGNAQLEEPFALIKSAVVNEVLENADSTPYSFCAFQDLPDHATVEENGKKEACERFDGYVAFPNGAVLLDKCWQTWPKSLTVTQEAERTKCTFGILPELPQGYGDDPKKNERDTLIQSYYWLRDDGYQFKRGMEITTEFWFASEERVKSDPNLREHLKHPLFAACEPEYYCAVGVFPPVNPVRPGVFEKYESAFRKSWNNHLQGREQRGEYGWMNFGDWFGERTYNWGNNEYDLSFLCALQFARSGDLAILWRGVEMAKHYSTVDFRRYTWKNPDRERQYLHCMGHVNGFFTPDDPRLQELTGQIGKSSWWFRSESDGSGGHDTQPGNFYIGYLTGDTSLLDVGRIACSAQAKYMTPNFRISIERAAAWPMINASAAYQFTNDPVYLNAARIYFEKVEAQQNPETGCFDLPQDQTECDCPDKKEHRGGKAFAVGMLLHGLGRYYEQEPDPARRERIETVMVRCADWLLDSAWNEGKGGFRYKTGCPKYADHAWYSILVIDGLAHTSAISGDRRYLDFVVRTAGQPLGAFSREGRGSGKDFTQKFRQTPLALYWIQKLTGKTDL
ncbi:MAG: hypothetical protein Q4D38_01540 [Planctomycetia bacterium]|nr:hypothetical protein [Planctomycetia bacterium]